MIRVSTSISEDLDSRMEQLGDQFNLKKSEILRRGAVKEVKELEE